jgi:hypothetical protein
MPMIEIDKLKSASDAVQSAKEAWHTAVDAMNDLDREDIEGMKLAVECAMAAHKVYIDMACELAQQLQSAIYIAEREG